MTTVMGNESTVDSNVHSPGSMRLTSNAFGEGEPIPRAYTCDGEDYSPDLAWSNMPSDTRSLALICSDPDAPRATWIHWVLYNIPPARTSLPGRIPPTATIGGGGTQGMNDFGNLGYGGPCPPSGVHRYRFDLFALDLPTDLTPGLDARGLQKLMEGHTLATTRLTGRYGRE